MSKLPHRQCIDVGKAWSNMQNPLLVVGGLFDRTTSYKFDLKAQKLCAPFLNYQKTDEH
jgi:hypothetical protein